MDATLNRHIVQFLHPGSEYRLRKTEGDMAWNTGAHHRKFMYAHGDFVDGNKRIYDKELLFWGEWEPQSKYTKINLKGSPRYLHHPCLDLGAKENTEDGEGRNTDPFVFADAFYYRCCQQMRKTGPTELFRLAQGSIVLFGSKVSDYFALDTVFVVDENRLYNSRTDLKGFIPDKYADIARIAYEGKSPVGFRCYRGATFEKRVIGMYSFVPCRLHDDNEHGFERPVLTHKDLDYINEKQMQGFKLTRNVTPEESRAAWEKIREICQKQHFLEGLKFYYELL